MQSIIDIIKAAKIGAPTAFKNLAMFPILNGGRKEAGYLILDEAMAAGTAHITEVSEGGSVPELKFVNTGKFPVFLLDGEELVGAKQNRVLNLSILAPAGKTLVIPVSCVEAGRWVHWSPEFASAPRAQYAAGRAKKMAQVTHSLEHEASRHSDQSGIWADISEKCRRMGASSPTGAMAAMFEEHGASLEDFVRAFAPLEVQAGALFTIDGKIAGLDLFDCSETLHKLLPKLVRSYALDALDALQRRRPEEEAAAPTTREQAEVFLHSVAAARREAFSAVGEGQDVRFSGSNLTGAALVVDEQVIHLSAFRLPGTEQNGTEQPGSGGVRLSRPSMRRSHHSGAI